DELRGALAVVRVDVEARDAVLDDLERAAVTGREGGQARDHAFDHGETERLEEGRLDEDSAPFRDVAIELTGELFLEEEPEPADVVIELMGVEEGVHLRVLLALLGVLAVLGANVTRDHDDVRELPQPLVLRVPLDEARKVLDPVEAREREDDRLLSIGEDAARIGSWLRSEDQLLDLGLETAKSTGLIGVRKERLGARAGRDDVETRIIEVDALGHPIEARHGERPVALVLADALVRAGDLLIRARDDEIRRVHGD